MQIVTYTTDGLDEVQVINEENALIDILAVLVGQSLKQQFHLLKKQRHLLLQLELVDGLREVLQER
jgi:hypothetical protein